MNPQSLVPNKQKEPSKVLDPLMIPFYPLSWGQGDGKDARKKYWTYEDEIILDPTPDKKTGSSPYAASCNLYPKQVLMKMEINVSGSLKKKRQDQACLIELPYRYSTFTRFSVAISKVPSLNFG
jgi:hypothetical protein